MGLAPQPILTASPLVARGQFGARTYGPGEAAAQRAGYLRQRELVWGREAPTRVVLPDHPGEPVIAPAPKRNIKCDPEAVARRFAEIHGTTLDALREISTAGLAVVVRQIAMATLYVDCPDLNFVRIGALLHARPSTVARACRKLGVHPTRNWPSGAPPQPVPPRPRGRGPARIPADNWFGEPLVAPDPRDPRNPTAVAVGARVAAQHGLTWAMLIAPGKHPGAVHARQIAMATVYVERPAADLGYIGRLFGGRDRATVRHALIKFGVYPHRIWPDDSPHAPRSWDGEGLA